MKYYNKKCFAYGKDKNGVERCSALKVMKCYKCVYAKTREEYEKAAEKAAEKHTGEEQGH